MSIRFACTNCRQALAIAARKAGSKVKCPKCQTELTVPAAPADAVVAPAAKPAKQSPAPQPSTATANKLTPSTTSKPAPAPKATPAARAAKPAERDPSFSSLDIQITASPAGIHKEPDFAELVFDDIPAAVNTPPTKPVIPVVETRPEAPQQAAVIDRSLVAVSRTVLYAQAVLIVAVALLAFVIGYFAGRGQRAPTPDEAVALEQPVAIEGDVVFANDAGGDTPDVGAVVMAFPHAVAPGQKFAIAGLRPTDALSPDGAANLSIQAIASEGGAYTRADENGQFRFELRPGKYWLLVISAGAARPAGVLPTTKDVRTLGRYFETAADLIGDRRYSLTEPTLPDESPLEVALDK